MSSGQCVFSAYESVFERITIGCDDPLVKKQFEANVELLAGPVGVAARLARRDAEFGRPARAMDELCRDVCVEPCEAHPDGVAATNKSS